MVQCDYMDAAESSFTAAQKYLAAHGVTSAQCAAVSVPLGQILFLLYFYRNRHNKALEGECRFIGVHIAGPSLSLEAGDAHLPEILRTPLDGYDWILGNADIIREITVAPELPGMPQMIRDMTQKGIVVSGGHDRSKLADVECATAILVFNAAWNEFLFSAILSINKSKTLSVVISGFITDKGLEWGPMAALSMVLIVPVVVLAWSLQKDFVSGLTMGLVKE